MEENEFPVMLRHSCMLKIGKCTCTLLSPHNLNIIFGFWNSGSTLSHSQSFVSNLEVLKQK